MRPLSFRPCPAHSLAPPLLYLAGLRMAHSGPSRGDPTTLGCKSYRRQLGQEPLFLTSRGSVPKRSLQEVLLGDKGLLCSPRHGAAVYAA